MPFEQQNPDEGASLGQPPAMSDPAGGAAAGGDPRSFPRRVEAARQYLRELLPEPPEVVLVLGTGLGEVAELIENPRRIPYHTIPHFPRSTVSSHQGNLVCGRLQGRMVAALQGRFHYYEGYSTQELTMPIRVLSLLGAGELVVTGAAGGLDKNMAPGTLMLLNDHLNLITDNPLRGENIEAWGPRFPDLSAAYDRQLREKALGCAARLGLDRVGQGVYVAVPGPSLETPAETRWLRNCGADAVGMSVVPEVIVARHAGMRVLGVAVVSNVNDPDNFQPIILDDIIRESEAAAARLKQLLLAYLE